MNVQCTTSPDGHVFYSRFVVVHFNAVMTTLCQDGLVSSTDAALRDLSAASLKEFVHWSIKQSTPQVKHQLIASAASDGG